MRGLRWLLVGLLVVLSSVLALACGGEEEEEPGAPTGPAATRPAGETPEAQETPEAREDGGESSDLARKFREADFEATYEFSSSEDGGVGEGTMTWYKKGDSFRMDIEIEDGLFVIIDRPDQSYFCLEAPDMGNGGFCLSGAGTPGDGPPEFIGELEDVLTNPDVELTVTGGRSIAGEDADCYTVRSPEFEGEAEACVSNDGVLLSLKGKTAGVETSIEATELSRDVSDDDFEPPYPASEDFPDLPDMDIDIAD